MYTARLICSDSDCEFEERVEADTLAELEALACACGCGLAIVGWPEVVESDELAAVVGLRRRGVLVEAA